MASKLNQFPLLLRMKPNNQQITHPLLELSMHCSELRMKHTTTETNKFTNSHTQHLVNLGKL